VKRKEVLKLANCKHLIDFLYKKNKQEWYFIDHIAIFITWFQWQLWLLIILLHM
jgi:hypothetical protein